MTFRCARCSADLRPEGFGDDRRCAFTADGSFTSDNWNCATLNALIGEADNRAVEGCDERFEWTPVNGTDYGGWVITTRYKHRGCTSSAIVVGDFYPPKMLTLALAEQIITGIPVEHEDEP